MCHIHTFIHWSNTQGANLIIRRRQTIHTHSYTVGVTIRSNLGLSIPKTSIWGLEEMGIELPIFWLVDDPLYLLYYLMSTIMTAHVYFCCLLKTKTWPQVSHSLFNFCLAGHWLLSNDLWPPVAAITGLGMINKETYIVSPGYHVCHKCLNTCYCVYWSSRKARVTFVFVGFGFLCVTCVVQRFGFADLYLSCLRLCFLGFDFQLILPCIRFINPLLPSLYFQLSPHLSCMSLISLALSPVSS